MRYSSFVSSFFELLYPNTCVCCQQLLKSDNTYICFACRFSLPKSQIIDLEDNMIHQLFAGRVPIQQAFSLYKFQKKVKLQKLMHALKYEQESTIGIFFGKQLGITLQLQNALFFDYIIPIPLHWRKEQKMGYNQSLMIAEGLSETTQTPIANDVVIRSVYSDSQINKKRFERWENVGEIFRLTQASKVYKKHILLIDDLVTTGATLEACAQTILKAQEVKISVATMAYA